jgi:hypothetical protein
MAHTYDDGLKRVTALAAEFEKEHHTGINEDTTRLRFVDTVFFECLDWDKFSQVQTEEHTDVGVIDYSMTIGVPLLVVEAKKVGVSFSLPVEQGKNNRILRSVQAVASLDKGIEGALSQAARYALEKGAPFVAVSNGWQVVAFCSQPGVGVGWRKGGALVFESLACIRDNFREFWEVLSVEAVRRFHLRQRLSKPLNVSPALKKSSSIKNYDRSKNRNDFQADLQILGDLVFGGRLFEDRKLFQEYCYCAGGAIPQFSRASRSYLEDRYPEFFSSTANTPMLEPAQTKKGPAAALANLTNIRKPILLLGDVGVGKNTFLEHLFLVDWSDKSEDLIVIRVDLADKPSRADDLPSVVAQEIERSLLEHYEIDINEDKFIRAVYHGELLRFRRSPEGSIRDEQPDAFALAEVAFLKSLRARFDEHIRALFKHLVKGRRKMVVLIFDNVDQRSSDLQSATFIQAQIAASTWDVFVMVALRPDTFVRAKLAGEIAGYHPRAFTISPPRFDQLMSKRIIAAIRMLNGELPVPNVGGSAAFQAKNVASYLSVLQHSFASNPDLLTFCEDISGGNMRLALDYVIAFMSCGHVDALKILERWQEKGGYTIPLHEFIRGVMFAEREYYSGASAMIMNVYDCKTGDPKEVFAVLCVLAFLSVVMSNTKGDKTEGGYATIEDVRQSLVSAGFLFEQACWAVERSLEHRLVETNLKSGVIGEATHVRISATGSYYISTLVRTFVYTDAVCTDTPIADNETYQAMGDVYQLADRLERASVFVDFLSKMHELNPSLRGISTWDAIAEGIRKDVALVQEAAVRAAQRRS